MYQSFPNTNFHELNLDWVLTQVKELRHFIDNLDIGKEVQEKIDETFNSLMIDAIYDEKSETITLLKEITGGESHTYDESDTAMVIK